MCWHMAHGKCSIMWYATHRPSALKDGLIASSKQNNKGTFWSYSLPRIFVRHKNPKTVWATLFMLCACCCPAWVGIIGRNGSDWSVLFVHLSPRDSIYIYICMIIQEAPLFSITPSSFLSSDQRAPRRSPCKHTRTRAHNTDSHTLLRAVWNNITYIVLQIISRTAFRKSSALRSSGVLGQIEMARIEAKMPLCVEQVMY